MQHIALTGGSSGLGACLAHVLAERGKTLTLLGRDETRLASVGSDCRRAGGDVTTLLCDVRDGPAMRDALLSADERAPIDLVIANAGIGGRAVLSPASGEPPELAKTIFDVNVLGVVHTVTPLIERFIARRRGHIAIISSVAAMQGLPDSPAYSASKAAIRIYGQGLRRLLACHNIKVTIICPGFIRTPMSQSLPVSQPFACSADHAAQIIVRSIERGDRELVFPWQLRWAANLLDMLPDAVCDGVLNAASSRIRRAS